jgi:glyceraldehyde-3-phosphate dehydrogenase/erythrose-4-phosphate dehydrogenase
MAKKNRVKIVVDTTGVFNDPTVPDDNPNGSLRGHLTAGAWKVINSAPFKIKVKTKKFLMIVTPLFMELIILNLTFQDYLNKDGESRINRDFLNNIYKESANGLQKNLLCYSKDQNISSDLKGKLFAVIIEAHDTHTRTGFINLNPDMLGKIGLEVNHMVNIPVTHCTLFGWYDNEYGSYVNCLGKLVTYIDSNL